VAAAVQVGHLPGSAGTGQDRWTLGAGHRTDGSRASVEVAGATAPGLDCELAEGTTPRAAALWMASSRSRLACWWPSGTRASAAANWAESAQACSRERRAN
jgi:hypothetical protein